MNERYNAENDQDSQVWIDVKEILTKLDQQRIIYRVPLWCKSLIGILITGLIVCYILHR